jgi:cytoskeleton protein RodZ
MKITGELLKAERIKRNLTVAEVAATLKLSSKIITSIESGDVDELPAKTFIRGFVKSYATLLKLDPDLILRQFQEEMGSTQPMPKNAIPTSMPSQAVADEKSTGKSKNSLSQAATKDLILDRDHKKKTIVYVSIAAALIAVILIINSTIEKYQKEAVVDKNKIEQIQPINPSAEVKPGATIPSIAPMSAAAESTNSSAAIPVLDPNATKSAESKLQDTAPAGTATTTKQSTVTEEKPAVPTTTPDEFEPSSGKPIEIIVEAKKAVDIYYAKGNTKNFTHVKLEPKQIQIIRSPAGLHLKAEDGSLLYLTINGVEKGPASAANKPVRLTF